MQQYEYNDEIDIESQKIKKLVRNIVNAGYSIYQPIMDSFKKQYLNCTNLKNEKKLLQQNSIKKREKTIESLKKKNELQFKILYNLALILNDIENPFCLNDELYKYFNKINLQKYNQS